MPAPDTEPGSGSWRRNSLKRVAGIEPATTVWKTVVLPLNYTRAMHPQIIAGVSVYLSTSRVEAFGH